ncbi:MAG: hypothetical protein DSM106950_11445 [Stigonema ocellatum SAG 48.90 = DSM 106950]|nr:hypothetical protein [Stigonema ocellatum SAG 48.90 = DSM 106950]
MSFPPTQKVFLESRPTGGTPPVTHYRNTNSPLFPHSPLPTPYSPLKSVS